MILNYDKSVRKLFLVLILYLQCKSFVGIKEVLLVIEYIVINVICISVFQCFVFFDLFLGYNVEYFVVCIKYFGNKIVYVLLL